MALRGVTPEAIQKRLKMLLYGVAGIGKTTTALGMPRPYLIDTEKGAENDQYVEALKKAGGAYFFTNRFDDMCTEIKALLSEKHPYRTLIIDPFTTVFNDLVDSSAEKVGTEWGVHYREANKESKHLMNLLTRLDMNVVLTCHSKNEYGTDMKVLGQTFDGYKKLDYLFDLVLELQRRGRNDRVAVVKKTRIAGFGETDVFPVGYDEIATRYGRETLEKEAVAQALATTEQIERIKDLIELFNVPKDTWESWLEKAKAEDWTEMPADAMQKCITHLETKTQKASK